MKRTPLLAAAFLLVLTVSGAHAQQGGLSQITLPAEITYPEGLAYDEKLQALYVGSAATSAVARIGLGSKEGTLVAGGAPVLPAEPFPGLLGIKVDAAGRLWAAGGRTGTMAVLDSRTGKELKRFQVPTSGKSLVNDVVVLDSGAYFTDTLVPTLWRVPVKGNQIGELEPWLEFAGSPLQYGEGANLNGIAATADGRYLVVVQMSKGLLFRIGVEDKRIVQIDTAGAALNTADGLVLDGRTLYVVRQGEQEVVTVELSEDLTKGRVVNRFKDPTIAWPATAAKVGDRLFVVSTQFNQRQKGTAKTPFWLVGIPLSQLAGK